MKTQSEAIRVGQRMQRVRFVIRAALAVMLLLAVSTTTARAAASIVVGDGTPESCTLDPWATLAVFNQAIADVDPGGTITFNCGPDPVYLFSSDGEISKDLTIDGGGLVTFTGHNPFYIASGTVQFVNFTIDHSVGDTAGAIWNRGTLSLHHVTLSRNYGDHGYAGGAIINEGILSIEDSVIVRNVVGCTPYGDCGLGGGIWNQGALHIVNSTIANNYAGADGGGIYNLGTVTIENSTIAGNRSSCEFDFYEEQWYCNSGGGIWNSGTLNVINSTISGNSAGNSASNSTGGSGGGIDNTGTLLLQNTTLTNNTAPSGGGLANHNSATLQNSLLAGNTDSNQQPSDCSGTLTSQGYNLIGNASSCTLSGNTTGNLLGVNPWLGSLQDNDGPTFTHALLPGSPAIDAGNPAIPGSGDMACEATDQRGVTRPQDGNKDGIARCDIGAMEVETPSFLPVTIDIRPGDSSNPINLRSTGVIPVTILSTSTFDATSVDPASVTFGPNSAGSVRNSLVDVSGDGQLDLVLHFRVQQTGLQASDSYACLVGQTRNGTPIEGCDYIHIVP
jgi:hypothetical protein